MLLSLEYAQDSSPSITYEGVVTYLIEINEIE